MDIDTLLAKKAAEQEAAAKAETAAKDKREEEAKAAKQSAPRKKWFDWSQIPDADLTNEEIDDFKRRVAFF